MVLWAGMIVTVGWVIVAGLTRFDPALAFAFPEDAWTLDARFARGLGLALGIAMYDLFGYYQVCNIGDEVVAPERTIPRSILISVGAVAAIYLVMNVSILGVLPAGAVMKSHHIASDFMQARHGPWAARLVTVLILWTGTASVFAGILGYSRVPTPRPGPATSSGASPRSTPGATSRTAPSWFSAPSRPSPASPTCRPSSAP